MPGTTWIRVSTAAKLKGVRRQSIYYHVREGNLRSMDMDGNTYVDREEVLALKPRGKGEYKKRGKKAMSEFVDCVGAGLTRTAASAGAADNPF